METPGAANGDASHPEGKGEDVGPVGGAEKAEDVEAGALAKPEYGPPADMTLLRVRRVEALVHWRTFLRGADGVAGAALG